jgi:hypothetical protein
MLLAFFGTHAGLILFFIDAFANPFTEPVRVSPAPFERLIAGQSPACVNADGGGPA